MKTALRSQIRSLAVAVILATGLLPAAAGAVLAQPGTPLGTVTLPGNGACSVAGSFDGTYYITVNTSSCSGTVIGIYKPPPSGAGPATLISTKAVVDGANNPVTISAVDWDAGRNLLWAVFGSGSGNAWLVDLGDKTLSGPATATLAFNYSIPGGFDLIDGLAYDFVAGDVLHISPDVSAGWWSFSATGTPMGMVTVKNASGQPDGLVSGLAIGSSNTMYVSRDGTGEIRRVNKSNGNFVSTFATSNERVEDLTCDATTYAPKEAVLAKDAFSSAYEAFEVEPGTCPQVAEPEPVPTTLELTPELETNDVGTQHCVTATVLDQNGDPIEGINVEFRVTGSVVTSGDADTNASGEADFCYNGPAFPGADNIHAWADWNPDDGAQGADEPFDDARKLWVLPVSTPGCEVKITNGGWIVANNGDKSSFGGVAMADGLGNASGNEEYQDHGPAQPFNLHGKVLVVVCDSLTSATIYGEATIDGAGAFLYRIRVEDNNEPGKGFDKYWMLIDNGYDSGNKVLKGGNVQIHLLSII